VKPKYILGEKKETIMEILYQALAITGMFSLIVVSHEFEHFVAARVAGVKVKKFSLGFGPVLFRTKEIGRASCRERV